MAGVFQPGVFQSNVFQTEFRSATASQSLSIGQSAALVVTDSVVATQALGVTQSVTSAVTVAAQATQPIGVSQAAISAVTVSGTSAQSLGVVSAETGAVDVGVASPQSVGVAQIAIGAIEVRASSVSSLSIESVASVSNLSEGSHGRSHSPRYAKQLFDAEKALRRRLRTKRDVPFSAPIPEQPRKVVALKPLPSIEELEKLLLQPPPSLAGLQPQEFADDEDAIIALLLAS